MEQTKFTIILRDVISPEKAKEIVDQIEIMMFDLKYNHIQYQIETEVRMNINPVTEATFHFKEGGIV